MGGKIKQALMIALGVTLVITAAIGVILPGIPTLGPLLCGSLILARCHPALEKRLVRNRFFAPYLPYIDGDKEMSVKTKLSAAAMMWVSIGVSCWVMVNFTSAPMFAVWLMPVAGAIGSFAIWRWGKGAKGCEELSPISEKQQVASPK